MDFAVKAFKSFSAMPDHGAGKSGKRFRRDLDRAGDEKLIVLMHEQERFNPQLSTSNAQF